MLPLAASSTGLAVIGSSIIVTVALLLYFLRLEDRGEAEERRDGER